MSARNVAPAMRRIGTGVARGDLRRLDPPGVRLLLRALLFDGASVPTWHALAACRETDAAVFFPAAGPSTPAMVAEAKQVCAGCPVRGECRADAMAWEMDYARHGVVGGLTATERHRVYVQQPDDDEERAA